jgi:hypothetical protein
VEKYLRHYAEPEITALDGLPAQPCWENVVVIPACNESAGFVRSPPACGGRSLMILVINELSAASPQVSARNRALAEEVRTRFTALWQSAPGSGLSLWRDPLAGRDVLLVDRFGEGRQIPARGGVGFARKLGSDLALSLIHRQRIRSEWIHCTDADVKLPATYFSCSNALRNTGSKYAALVYPFSHCENLDQAEDGGVFLATQLYELSLRYYVAGMKFARSPYAFHTIGSSMAVSAVHYARVRGFPRREAGEDFYLLNKLAKVGSVLELVQGPDCAAIEIASRRSDRVPFGTGAAVNKITAMEDPFAGFRFYDPAVFGLLKLWLQSLPAVWQSGSTELNTGVFSAQAEDQQPIHLRQALLDCLKTMKTDQALEHAFRQSGDLDQFSRQMHTWFDAFRTLKLIHALRDCDLPSISYARLIDDPDYKHLLTKDLDLMAFHERLGKNRANEQMHGNGIQVPAAAPITDCVKDIPNV